MIDEVAPGGSPRYRAHDHTVTAQGCCFIRSLRGFEVCHWTRDGMAFWAVSDLNAVELAQFRAPLEQ